MSSNRPVWKWRDWISLSENPNAISILKENTDKINWCNFSRNSSIFNLNYDEMKKIMKICMNN